MTPQDQVVNDDRYTPLYEHGFVGLIETMGSDEAICQAARVSYGTGTKSVSDDRNLIRYLKRHKHTSPFEMAEVKLHLKMPIFVMRQWIRHRTANVNEYSARYSELSNEFYIPAADYIAPQSTTNNQGRAGSLSENDKNLSRELMRESIESSYFTYEMLLNNHPDTPCVVPKGPQGERFFDEDFPGISRELARIPVPVANYTECYWKIDLHNLFHFLALRMDAHAQQEIRDYAQAVYELVKEHFPLSCEAFEDYQFNAKTLSRMDLLALIDMLQGNFVARADHYGMSKREYTEFVDFFKPSAVHSHQTFKTED
jgi:thymidylate synthase (FAD)